MNTALKQKYTVADHVWDIVDFCMANIGKSSFAQFTPEQAYNYVLFCLLTDKLILDIEDNKIKMAIFYWVDWKEHIEEKYENNKPQFSWISKNTGDSIFYGDIFGTMDCFKKIHPIVVKKLFKNKPVSIFTYRNNKLVCLSDKILPRIMKGNQ